MNRQRITRQEFLAAVGALATAGCVTQRRGTAVQKGDSRPNLVLFISDDHDLFYTSCYGNETLRTPTFDRLAREGLVFDRAFTATAMCAPSRSMLYTGLFPHRNGAHPNHSSVREGTRSLPHYLQPLGYDVVLAGKKHIKPPECFPFTYIAQDEVGAFLEGAGERPFCLVIASNEPHTPHATGGYTPDEIEVAPFLVDTPVSRQRIADYCTDIDLLDAEVADVLDLLQANGFDDNTLFIYTSDHGAPLPFAKWTCYEAGLHVPFIARWPKHIEPGTRTDAMISFVDVLPTFLELAGGPPEPNLDGIPFTGVLLGETDTHRDVVFGTHTSEGISNGSPYPIRAIRTATHKYIVNPMPEATFTNNITEGGERFGDFWQSWQQAAETDAFARERVHLYQHRPAEELYDLRTDLYELINLADAPESRALMDALRQQLIDWMTQQGDLLLARLTS